MIKTMLHTKTVTGRRSRTKMANNLFVILQAANLSAMTLQTFGLTPQKAAMVAAILAVLQAVLGNYLRDQTSEPMA